MRRLLIFSLFVFFGFVNVSIAQEVINYMKEDLIRDLKEAEREVVSTSKSYYFKKRRKLNAVLRSDVYRLELQGYFFPGDVIGNFAELFAKKKQESIGGGRTQAMISPFFNDIPELGNNYPIVCKGEFLQLSEEEQQQLIYSVKSKYRYVINCSMPKDIFIKYIETEIRDNVPVAEITFDDFFE